MLGAGAVEKKFGSGSGSDVKKKYGSGSDQNLAAPAAPAPAPAPQPCYKPYSTMVLKLGLLKQRPFRELGGQKKS